MHKIKAIIKNLLTELLFNIQKNKQVVAKKPSDIHLFVTEDCCLRCKMCNIWKLKEKKKNLDYQTAKKIIDKLTIWLDDDFQITFAGGEPFLDSDFIKIISYAHHKGIKTSTNTNGYIINNNLAKKIVKSGLTQIFFSVDGLEKEHNFIRGKKDSFKKIIEAINYLQKEKGSNNYPKIYLNTVISNNNLSSIKELVYFAKKIKVSGINFQALMPNFAGNYKSDWYNANPFWPKNKKQLVKNIEELIKLKKKYPDFILNLTHDLKNFINYFNNPKLFQENETCFVGYNNFMIDASGNMRLCYEMGIIGNVLKENPEKLWLSKVAKTHRQKIIECKKPCKLLPCNDLQISNWLKKTLTNNL